MADHNDPELSAGPPQSLGLAEALEALDGSDPLIADRLLATLRNAVSSGHFGLAAELSDRLQSTQNLPIGIQLQVQVERAKRLQYMGYEQPARTAVREALECLRRMLADDPSVSERQLRETEITLVGHLIWLEENVTQSDRLTCEFDHLLLEHERHFGPHPVLGAFAHAQQGWLAALRGDPDESVKGFEKALQCLEELDNQQVEAHIRTRYAEALMKLCRFDMARKEARETIKSLLSSKSHLTLKSVVVLLTLPEKFQLSEAERLEELRRARHLLERTGITQSVEAYRLLTALPQFQTLSDEYYTAEARNTLSQRVRSLSEDAMEVLVKRVLERGGYVDVCQFNDETVAFDIFANHPIAMPYGSKTCMAVQVKHRRAKLTYRDLWDTDDNTIVEHRLRKAKTEAATRGYRIPTEFLWYCTGGVHKAAKDRTIEIVRAAFGEHAFVEFVDLEWLLDAIERYHELPQQILSGLGTQETPPPPGNIIPKRRGGQSARQERLLKLSGIEPGQQFDDAVVLSVEREWMRIEMGPTRASGRILFTDDQGLVRRLSVGDHVRIRVDCLRRNAMNPHAICTAILPEDSEAISRGQTSADSTMLIQDGIDDY